MVWQKAANLIIRKACSSCDLGFRGQLSEREQLLGLLCVESSVAPESSAWARGMVATDGEYASASPIRAYAGGAVQRANKLGSLEVGAQNNPKLVLCLFEHLGVAVFSITGVLAAKNKRVDLFGVVVLALVTALGGGTLRDLILRTDPFWMSDTSFVLTDSATAAVTFVVARCWEPPATLLLVVNACGLALFTMLGTEKALVFSASNVAAIVLGVITGMAGGMIRDVLTDEVPLVLRAGIYLYATAALCGATVFVGVAPYLPSRLAREFIAVAVTLVLRLVAIRWRLYLPEFHTRSRSSK